MISKKIIYALFDFYIEYKFNERRKKPLLEPTEFWDLKESGDPVLKPIAAEKFSLILQIRNKIRTAPADDFKAWLPILEELDKLEKLENKKNWKFKKIFTATPSLENTIHAAISYIESQFNKDILELANALNFKKQRLENEIKDSDQISSDAANKLKQELEEAKRILALLSRTGFHKTSYYHLIKLYDDKAKELAEICFSEAELTDDMRKAKQTSFEKNLNSDGRQLKWLTREIQAVDLNDEIRMRLTNPIPALITELNASPQPAVVDENKAEAKKETKSSSTFFQPAPKENKETKEPKDVADDRPVRRTRHNRNTMGMNFEL